MPSRKPPRNKDSSSNSPPSSAGAPLSATSTISFSHTNLSNLQPGPSAPVKNESKSEPEFKVSFQFVGNQDARKATTENRSHVMREYRRKQRWEQEQKKKLQGEGQDLTADANGKSNPKSNPQMKSEDVDLENTLAMMKPVQQTKRKRSVHDSDYDKAMQQDFGYGTNTIAMQIISQMAAHATATHITPSNDGPVLDVFTQRFVDTFAPEAQNAGSATAIRSIATVRMFSPILTNAFNAVATTFMGQQMNDPQIVNAGHVIYTDVLKSLQESLAHPLYSRSEAVLSTVVLCIAFESMRHTTPEALNKHCHGALQLIEHRGPHAHVDGLEHLCFSEMRPYWAFAAIVFRKPTFLSEQRWKTIPWSSPLTSKDIMSHLLDHVCDLPAILYQFDMIKELSAEGADPTEILQLQHTLWHDTAILHASLLKWKVDHADTYFNGQPHATIDSLGKDPFPILKVRNPRTGETTQPPLIAYPDPQLARTLCTYYATLIVLGSVDTRPPPSSESSPYGQRIQPLEMFNFAVTILRSVEYFIRNVPGNMTNRMMYPLRAAFETMPKDGTERQFVGAVYKLIEKRNASMVLSRVTHTAE